MKDCAIREISGVRLEARGSTSRSTSLYMVDLHVDSSIDSINIARSSPVVIIVGIPE